MTNTNLMKARTAKNDEFYTQLADIEAEMNAYLEFDADVFRNKTVLLPCDDPEWSNFTKYFAQNFDRLELKKLISSSKSPVGVRTNGRAFVLERGQNYDPTNVQWSKLKGSGDFRSSEVTRFRDEADLIITNPPFSLFRKFMAWVLEGEKQFVIIGSMNAITYKEVFSLIMTNKMWLGNGFQAGNAYFRPLTGREYAVGVYDEKIELVKFGNAVWLTNLDHGHVPEPLVLMTEADNVNFSKHKEVRGVGYQKYKNYDAIEVPFTDAIPSDYPGVMGVPISFLDKYNPEQFEIVGNGRLKGDLLRLQDGRIPYFRLLIRHRRFSNG